MKTATVAVVVLCILVLTVGCSRDSREDLIQEGIRKTGEKDFRGAVVLFKSLLEKDQHDVQARFLLADAYLNAGKSELAEREFAQVGALDPSYPGLRLRRAELLLRQGKAAEARGEIEAHHDTTSPDAASLTLLGRAQLLNGETAAGEESLRSAIRLAPDDLDIRLLLADALGARGEGDAARELLRQLIRENEGNPEPYRHLAQLENAAGESGRALDLYRRAAELDPGDRQSAFVAGLLLLEKGRVQEAEMAADDLRQRFPDDPRGWRLQGFISYREGRYEESARHLQRVAEQYPDLLTFYILGIDYLRLGRSELAVTQLQRLLDYQPQALQARTVLALVLLRQGRSAEAINELRHVLAADDSQALAHHLLGSALLAKGSYDQAMAEFDRAVELDPGLAQAHLQKGLFTLSRGEIAKGEEYLVQALAVAPELPDVRLVLANHLLQQKKYAEARKILQEGLTGAATDALFYNFLAAASFGDKKDEAAIAFLAKAKTVKPDYFAPYYNLAAYYAARGDGQRVRQEYRAVLAIDPKEVKAWLLQAQAAETAGEQEEALSCYRQAKETGKTEGRIGLILYLLRQKQTAEAMTILDEGLRGAPAEIDLLQLKTRLLAGGQNYAEALLAAEEMAKVDPERGLPLTAEVLLAQGETEQAGRVAAQMVDRYPAQPAGYLLLAEIEERGGEAVQALQTVENAPTACRKDVRLRLKRAELLQKVKNFPAAAAAFQEIVDEHPDLPSAWFALGTTYDRIGDRRQASRCYQEVLNRQPEFVPALNNLAYNFADIPEKREEALRLAQRANRREPDNPWVLDTLGYVFFRQERLTEAKTVLGRAADLLPNEPAVLYHLGLVQHRLGKREEALTSLRKALAAGPFADAERARELLNTITASRAGGKES